MAIQAPSPTHAALRALRRDLVEINDAQLLQVVALVDRMAERGDADALIAPLRARFGRVRPPRPLRFTRLLFLPLDPVLIPASRYRAGMPAVPRTAAAPWAALVHAALGPRAAEIEALIAGHGMADVETVQAAGAMLWREAVPILLAAALPAGWAAAGLPQSLFVPLSRAVTVVLAEAEALHEVSCDVAAGLPIDTAAVGAFLDRAAPAGPDGWGLLLAVLLARLPATGTVLHEATQWATRYGEPAFIVAIERVLETELALLEARGAAAAELLHADLGSASQEVRRIVDLLDAFAGPSAPAARRARAETVRRELDGICRTRFADALTEELLAPLQAMTAADAEQGCSGLEVAARRLRGLEAAARRLGSGATYDMLLRQTATAVRSVGADAGLRLADMARLVEILAGPEAALALLDQGSPEPG